MRPNPAPTGPEARAAFDLAGVVHFTFLHPIEAAVYRNNVRSPRAIDDEAVAVVNGRVLHHLSRMQLTVMSWHDRFLVRGEPGNWVPVGSLRKAYDLTSTGAQSEHGSWTISREDAIRLWWGQQE